MSVDPQDEKRELTDFREAVSVPIPKGDPRHDIGDDARAAIYRRLVNDWSTVHPDLSEQKIRDLAGWAAAVVRSLLSELGTLRDLAEPAASLSPRAEEWTDQKEIQGLPGCPAGASTDDWKPIDTAPHHGEVITFGSLGLVVCVYKEAEPKDWQVSDWITAWDGSRLSSDPTHWLPIPTPPKFRRQGR